MLNASGGLESGRDADYAASLNRDAQVELVLGAMSCFRPDARVVFVTSHFAHFHDSRPGHAGYEVVVESKHAGEQALRNLSEFAQSGVTLIVVSADIVEGTITPRLLERATPGLLAARREAVGRLPTVDDLAREIVAALVDENVSHGETRFVGSTD